MLAAQNFITVRSLKRMLHNFATELHEKYTSGILGNPGCTSRINCLHFALVFELLGASNHNFVSFITLKYKYQ
jgi:hypothetical protein